MTIEDMQMDSSFKKKKKVFLVSLVPSTSDLYCSAKSLVNL